MNTVKQVEVWRKVIGTEFYEVSSLGRVRSLDRVIFRSDGQTRNRKGKMLSQCMDRLGYLRVDVADLGNGRSFRVHKLVAEAWLGPRPDGLEVNHRDGKKQNNTPANLEYITHKENMAHAFLTGLADNHRGEDHYNAKLNETQVREIFKRRTDGERESKLAAEFDVTHFAIYDIFKGRSWKCLGLVDASKNTTTS